MNSAKEINKLARWATPRHANIPPLIHDGRLISNQVERAITYRDNLLARNQSADDLPTCKIPDEAETIWMEELSEIEVRYCTVGDGNTCAGADGISVELLATCWDLIRGYIN